MARLILSSCLGLVLLGSVTAIAEPSAGSDLSGVYACEGTNPDGSPYTAVVEIVKRQDTYLVRWTQENDEQVMGVGIQQDGVLAVSYFGGAPAIVVYSVATDGRLSGQWTMGGAGQAVQGNADESLRQRGRIQAGQAGQTGATGQAGIPACIIGGLHQRLDQPFHNKFAPPGPVRGPFCSRSSRSRTAVSGRCTRAPTSTNRSHTGSGISCR